MDVVLEYVEVYRPCAKAERRDDELMSRKWDGRQSAVSSGQFTSISNGTFCFSKFCDLLCRVCDVSVGVVLKQSPVTQRGTVMSSCYLLESFVYRVIINRELAQMSTSVNHFTHLSFGLAG